jgi:hypothetical protein
LYQLLCSNAQASFKQYQFDPVTGTHSKFFPILQETGNGDFEMVRFRLDDGYTKFESPLKERILELVGLLEEISVEVMFEEGEGYVLDNQRWMHGRNRKEFSGDRQVAHILVNSN